MTTFSVGYLIGSLAKQSINRKLALALTRLAPEHLRFKEIPIGELPLYSYDYDADFPPVAKAFKDAIASVDAVEHVAPHIGESGSIERIRVSAWTGDAGERQRLAGRADDPANQAQAQPGSRRGPHYQPERAQEQTQVHGLS